jgi:hypothetical protein
MNQGAAAPISGPGVHAGPQQPLDEVMLAMDVVDTLRRRERLVKRELDVEGREEDLRQRLRRIYAAQGIEVPDRIIEEGVAALKADRFAYRPPTRGLANRLARIYVSRGRWGKWLLGGIGAVIVAGVVNYFVVVAPNAALPAKVEAAHARAVELARSEEARASADRLLNAGEAALGDDDPAAAREALRALEDLNTRLSQAYTLRIVNRPGERSGVWRVPDVNTGARNYYIIVEAVDPTGRVLTVPITNEETGRTERVTQWGLRVDEDTFQRIARDKRDDGIIQRDRFGQKHRGQLEPEYVIPTTGSAITAW